jgi:hypothetical protein|tara:strand:+ start:6044 stop:6259 length:216 start_codon:yes stop_codon:yes gene_type:complete
MKIIKRELYRHFHFVRVAEDIVYSNPKHIKGLFAYRDKKRLYDLKEKIQKNQQTLTFREFQFLESIVEKYG